jgi:hypothetical protein
MWGFPKRNTGENLTDKPLLKFIEIWNGSDQNTIHRGLDVPRLAFFGIARQG